MNISMEEKKKETIGRMESLELNGALFLNSVKVEPFT